MAIGFLDGPNRRPWSVSAATALGLSVSETPLSDETIG